MTDLSLTTARRINAPVAAVFNAWLDPALLAKFMLPGEGSSVRKAATDPREGGRFEIVMAMGDNEMPHAGTYTEITPHSRLVFTWESPFSAEGSTVTLSFADAGDAATDVELVHVKFRDQESRDNHNAGWSAILAKLDEALA